MKTFPRTTISLAVTSLLSLAMLSACNKTEDTTTTAKPANTAAAVTPVKPAEAANGLTSAEVKATSQEAMLYLAATGNCRCKINLAGMINDSTLRKATSDDVLH